MIVSATDRELPVRTYARLLLELDALMVVGRGDSEEANAIREQMDEPWYAMTEREQERVGGLSEDLYALAEGGAKPVEMTPEQRKAYGERWKLAYAQRDWDQVLALLRHPPADIPGDAVAFLQARLWERLGHPDVALVFMRQAERLNPEEHTVSVMHLVGQLGQREKEKEYAERIFRM